MRRYYVTVAYGDLYLFGGVVHAESRGLAILAAIRCLEMLNSYPVDFANSDNPELRITARTEGK